MGRGASSQAPVERQYTNVNVIQSRAGCDPSPEVRSTEFYQSAIGTLRWAIELGWIDIITETSKCHI